MLLHSISIKKILIGFVTLAVVTSIPVPTLQQAVPPQFFAPTVFAGNDSATITTVTPTTIDPGTQKVKASCGWLDPTCWLPFIISALAAIIISLLGKILSFLVGLTITTLGTYNGFIESPAVGMGWSVVRDIGNMFFVLILLLISFGTILGLEQYQLKRLLPKVLLMALLVNFSKTIAGLFIDFAQIVMLTFANAYQLAGAGNFASALKLQSILSINSDAGITEGVQIAGWTIAGGYLLALVYLIVAIVVVGAFAAILAVRIVFLWLLIIFSPMVYVLSVLPIGQKYASQWWDMFSKYVIVGPLMAFFLWLSLATLPSLLSTDKGFVQNVSVDETADGVPTSPLLPDIGITEAGAQSNLTGFIMAIAMLMVSLYFAMETGGAVGKIAGAVYGKLSSAGVKTAFAPFNALGDLASFAESTLYANKGWGLDPRRLIRGTKGYFARRRGENEVIGQRKATANYKEYMEAKSGRLGMALLALGATEDFLQIFMKGKVGRQRFGRTLRDPGRYSEEAYKEGEEDKIRSMELVKEAEAIRSEPELIAEARVFAARAATEKLTEGKIKGVQAALPEVLPAMETYQEDMKNATEEEKDIAAIEADLLGGGTEEEIIQSLTQDQRASLTEDRSTLNERVERLQAKKVEMKKEGKDEDEIQQAIAKEEQAITKATQALEKRANRLGALEARMRAGGMEEKEVKEATKERRAKLGTRRKTIENELTHSLAEVAERHDLTQDELKSVLYEEERDAKGDKTGRTVSVMDQMAERGILIPAKVANISGPEREDYKKQTESFIESIAKEKGHSLVSNSPVFQDLVAEQMKAMGYGETGKETLEEKEKLKALAKEEYKKEQTKKEEELTYLQRGGYTEDQKKQVDARIEDLLRKLVAVDKRIEEAAGDPDETSKLKSLKRSLLNNLEEQKKKEKIIATKELPAEQKEIDANRDLNKNAIKEARFRIAELKGYAQQDNSEEDIEKIRKQLKAQAKRFSDKNLARSEPVPQTFYADRVYRALEQQELSKLPRESMEWEELGDLLERAIQEGNMLQVSTFMKKAAEDYNDNEIYKDNGLPSGPEGAEKFRKDRLEKIFGKQGSMQLMSEMSYINEAHNHNNVSRMYGMKNGRYYYRTREEQAAAAATENLKQDSRKFIQNHNRLGYGYEDARGNFHLDLSGKLTLAGFQDDFAYRLGRAEVNPSLIMKLSEDIEALFDMQRRGMLTASLDTGETLAEAIDRMGRFYRKRGVGTSYSGLQAQAIALM
ncbi:hypothetical protein COV04_00175 [Candidatus Uhrbacteria bacterium CG10_big_fil_rev_8_21_14_0_10_48_11]|uniref:Uncharacterized protein n=1 Tax=Candidatus Uhrbacteria bacterium CG10_big_fil_rev_8_21_14_0_10_48_11 TaxID=1975037 RepID=A0A2M8LFT5_9BACT|nr:MAG: hypothetical protein COV04_00175 [Candidatus Uhrbacteria bacterium CG10_big_fil_rev_8_21_14_0_10_48_11]